MIRLSQYIVIMYLSLSLHWALCCVQRVCCSPYNNTTPDRPQEILDRRHHQQPHSRRRVNPAGRQHAKRSYRPQAPVQPIRQCATPARHPHPRDRNQLWPRLNSSRASPRVTSTSSQKASRIDTQQALRQSPARLTTARRTARMCL